MTFGNIETKWNADNEKMQIIMGLEVELTQAFKNYDYGEIYSLLRTYRLNADPKFSAKSQEDIEKELEKLSKLFSNYLEERTEKNAQEFFAKAEEFFLKISRALKVAGIYYREGKNASNAILQR